MFSAPKAVVIPPLDTYRLQRWFADLVFVVVGAGLACGAYASPLTVSRTSSVRDDIPSFAKTLCR